MKKKKITSYFANITPYQCAFSDLLSDQWYYEV